MNAQELPKTYDPAAVEDKWYAYWLEQGYFRSTPDDRPPYTIVMPPPNVTGVLHMGHVLNNTIQDVLVRRKRMTGFNALWLPGTDHASIATEAKVVGMLRGQGIKKSDLTRDEFLNHAWAWTHKYGGIILEQLKKLGASCDWERTRFTMDPELSESVLRTFVDLHKKGCIYKGLRMVHWDPQGRTALSDEEVIYKEVNGKLYYVRYKIDGAEDEWITIATTRPETILADTGIAVHPEDERYRHLIGRFALLPFLNRRLPIVGDDYVEREFGTGCLKVTPAHDTNDYDIGLRHNLPVIDILTEGGLLNEDAQLFVGLDRFEARKAMTEVLRQTGHLTKVEEVLQKVGFSERTDAVVEPRLSKQWFVNMKKLAEPALKAVLETDEVRLIPPRFGNTYRHWMENIRDWCISRQLWWGHRIPAWYYPKDASQPLSEANSVCVVALTHEEAYATARLDGFDGPIEDLKQEDDVLDTWFSSWLWPLSVFDGLNKPNNPDIKYYYPTDDLVTAPEILFFWVARMVMAGYEYRHERPFKNVYLTGIVRDKQGRKMSKSLGNSPEPLDLIAHYGADGVRMGMLLCSPAGNDLLFDESQMEQGRNFSNKIWNAFRFVLSLEERTTPAAMSRVEIIAIRWMAARIAMTYRELDQLFEQFRLSEATMALYKLVWDDFCSWFIEVLKPATGESISTTAYQQVVILLEDLLKMLHPVMPFITEELWQRLHPRTPAEALCITQVTAPGVPTQADDYIRRMDDVRKIITQIRAFRAQKALPNKQTFPLYVKSADKDDLEKYTEVFVKLAGLESIVFTDEAPAGACLLVVDKYELYIPLPETLDRDAERAKIQEEIAYLEGFQQTVLVKLNNPKFVANAKAEVLEREQQKNADTETKLGMLRKSLENLN